MKTFFMNIGSKVDLRSHLLLMTEIITRNKFIELDLPSVQEESQFGVILLSSEKRGEGQDSCVRLGEPMAGNQRPGCLSLCAQLDLNGLRDYVIFSWV